MTEHLDCIRLLARNGIALRNDDEDKGNLRQQLQHSTRHIPYMKKYLTDNRYLSHQITSEMVKQMYRHVMKELIGGVKSAGYFSIVIDETQDGAGIEQCALVLRYVEDEYIIHEVVIGLYQADKCDAKSLTDIKKTALLSLDLDIKLLRGQTYDGTTVLQGKHSGVAKRIRDIANKALQLHCLNHNINLVLQEASSTTNLVSGALSTVQKLCVIIKGSPKRLAVFKELQSGHQNPTSIKTSLSHTMDLPHCFS